MKPHSQFGEDAWIILNPPFDLEHGTFCEVGAFDGIQSSNTLLFEELFGWKGICIEADPETALKCRANRKATTLHAAIGLANNGVGQFADFYINDQDRGISSLTQKTKHRIKVPLLRLDFVLGSLLGRAPTILSIDTEGNEIECFQSLNPGSEGGLPPIVIMEFWSKPADPSPEIIVNYMRQFGYREVHRTEANLIFYR